MLLLSSYTFILLKFNNFPGVSVVNWLHGHKFFRNIFVKWNLSLHCFCQFTWSPAVIYFYKKGRQSRDTVPLFKDREGEGQGAENGGAKACFSKYLRYTGGQRCLSSDNIGDSVRPEKSNNTFSAWKMQQYIFGLKNATIHFRPEQCNNTVHFNCLEHYFLFWGSL